MFLIVDEVHDIVVEFIRIFLEMKAGLVIHFEWRKKKVARPKFGRPLQNH
jgi:hypothetical protein